MSPPGRGQTQKKPASPASNGQNEKKNSKSHSQNKSKQPEIDNSLLESDISFDGTPQSLEEVKKDFEIKLKLIETKFSAHYDTMTKILEKKEEAIGQLNQRVGELTGEINCLKDSLNFMSGETMSIKEKLQSTQEIHEKKMTDLQHKTEDLEDRGRRNNLVFYGIPEPESGAEAEDCENKLYEMLRKYNIVPQSADPHNLYDRVHRLGRKKEDKSRPRPIIARFTYFKDKEDVLKQGFKLKNCPLNMSEDFSKATLNIRSQLITKAKLAQNNESSIINFRVRYKRLIIKYANPSTNAMFYRGFDLHEIESNPYWYIPRGHPHQPTPRLQNQGYQSVNR